MRKTRILVLATSATAALLVGEAQGGLTLTIDILTPDEFKFTLGGTFDADVVGGQRQWLAVKNDWTNNFGVNTDWLDASLGFTFIFDAPWTVVENSVLIGGLVPIPSVVAADGQTWGDSIYFAHSGGDILAGTTVSGSVHVQGVGLFDDSITNLELLSGFDELFLDWVRLEAAPGPCPWDLDGTGVVGVSDLLSMLASWGPCKGCPADFDGNDDVGVSDLLVLLANWGPCP